MKRLIPTLATLFFLAGSAAPAAAEVLRIDLDVQGYLCGL